YLGLSDPQTNVISEFAPAFPAQQTDISYGRDRADVNQVGFYPTPTPGSNNVTSGLGFGPEVVFSRAGGTFISPFNLVLTTASNAVIRYTLVNSAQTVGTATNIPTATSTLYTGPIAITGTVQVRARAFPTAPGFFPGPPLTESYIQLSNGTTNFVSTLPIVVIHTLGAATISGGFPALDNSVIIECFDNDGGMSSLNKPPQLVTRGGINLRGSSTQGYPKGSYAVELWDEFNEDTEKSFLGLPKESDWVLYAPNAFDISLMHNPIMHKFARDMGYYSSRTRFVEVFFRNGSGALTADTNLTAAAMGDYNGVYVLEEKIKRDGNRVDIDELEPEHTNSTTITGGWLLKIDRDDANERTFAANGVNDNINYQDPDGLEMVPPITAGRAAQAAYIVGYFNSMNAGLAGNLLTNVASTNHYSNYIDIDATIDHHIVNVAVMNVDGYRLSGYIHKPRGGKLIFGPVWDVDRGLGTSRGDLRAFNPRAWQAWDPLGASDYGTDFFQGATPPGFMARWFTDVDFWQRWIDRYQFWRTTVLETNRVAGMVDGFGQELREAQVREVKRWGGNGGSDTSPRTGIVNAGGNVYSHNFPGTYQGEVDFQRRWLLDHIHFMDTNLLNRPALNTAEGQLPLGSIVTLTGTSGKAGGSIYFTLDGSDPRGFQGTTNPLATLYTQPITVTNNVRIRARAVNVNHRNLTGISGPGSRNPVVSSPWSGDIASTFFITPPPLVITELMYHPQNSADPDQDPDDFEYVELKNIGSNTLNLVGFRFTNGIDFTFTATNGVTSLAPGGHVLLVKNLAAFNSRYGVHPNVAGQYGGTLDNAGERLTLVGPRLEPILDFAYQDDWYSLSDGFGFSLVIQDPDAPLNTWDLRSSWRLSSTENGSPGILNPPAPNLPVVLINEALTHTDLPTVDVIELYNPGTNDVNIGGWYLSDDATEPKKYEIPSNTILPAGSYVLFDESQFNTGLNGFSLESDGDEVYLFSAVGGLLTGYAHGFDYGAAPNGVTFGRYVNSQGEEHFVAQVANTLGATNSLPRVGPVVISEVMYHPPDTLSGSNRVDNSLDEFIELHNIAGTNVALFDSANPSNTWKLTQAVDFNFPTNSSIAAGGFILLVNFNPATNASQVAAFRAKYGVSPAVPLFGPNGGKLDNSSESVRLRRPDAPNTNGVPDILVDQVNYAADGVWSKAADGAGASLQRRVLGAYGNDPTNWTAARPTPGGNFGGGALPGITQQPSSALVFVQGTTNFTVAVTGVAVSVQWRFNGDPIPGATNATLTLAGVQYGQAGVYDAVAFNGGGAVISSTAQLAVLSPLTFSIQPLSHNALPGTNVTLTAAAFGTGPIRYQWYYEGTNGIETLVLNATNASFSFSNASLVFGHGRFRVVATDDFESLSSSNASIFVLVRPGFVVQPQALTLLQEQSATFRVVVTGAPPIYYRWIRAGTPYLTNDVPCLTLTNVLVGASIRVAVTNMATGPGGINSTTVQMMVLADDDRDGMADAWELIYGFNTNNAADGALDSDGDGMLNRDEYGARTNPNDPASLLKLVLTATNSAALQFIAQTNISYGVQYSTNLSAAGWLNVTSITAGTNVRTAEVIVPTPPPEPARFYRIVTPAPLVP
ncbi:MAG TPA: lamin tail domain-containing protein, partial [Methylomirabilota bacterium]|nr:lamin tail domain-containing protein [Methylomirabilota bacterium]